MADAPKVAFAPFAAPRKGVLVLFCEEGLKFGPATRKALAPAGDLVERAAAADRFTGKSGSAIEISAPVGLSVTRLVVLGAGKAGKLKSQGYVKLGGAAMGYTGDAFSTPIVREVAIINAVAFVGFLVVYRAAVALSLVKPSEAAAPATA